jgi:hypothetical protein
LLCPILPNMKFCLATGPQWWGWTTMNVSEIRTQGPPGSQLKTKKWRTVLARQNVLLKKGTWAHVHSTHKGAGSLSLLIFLTRLTLPLDLDWSRSKVHSLLDWLKFYTNLGEGWRYTAWQVIFAGKGV